MMDYYLFLMIFIPSFDYFSRKMSFRLPKQKTAISSLLNYLLIQPHRLDPQAIRMLKPYKFYGDLLNQVAIAQQNYGIGIQNTIEHLVRALKKEEFYSLKIKELKKTSYLQFILLLVVIYLFMGLTLSIMSFSLPSQQLFLFGIWPCLGIYCFSFGSNFLYQKLFHDYDQWIKELILFKSYLEIGKPLSWCLAECRVKNLSQRGHFSSYYQDLITGITELNQRGVPLQKMLDRILDGVWSNYEQDLERFSRYLNIVRLVILFIFFLSTYFSFLYVFISTFMAI